MVSLKRLNFNDFITPENYLCLQNTFLEEGKGNFQEIYEIVKAEDLKIKYDLNTAQGFLNGEPSEEFTLNFLDYLSEEVPKIAKRTYEEIIKNAEAKNRYSPEEINHFVKPIIESINDILGYLNKSNYLSTKIKKLVIDELHKLLDLCESYSENPYPGIKSKVPIKWNKTQVAYFFHLLKENNQLGDISDADLGRVIDNAFSYLKEGTQSEFLPIKNSKKLLSDFKVTSGRPEEPSNNTLEQIFQGNFFAH